MTAVVTTGAVTYVEYTWYLRGCERVHSLGPLIRDGRHFSYDFSIERESGVPCPMYVILETTNIVLGTLAPDTYTLVTTSWNVPIGTNTFTIRPALRPVGFNTNGWFQMELSCGVADVNYILQCSSNLLDWTSVSTNTFPVDTVGAALSDNGAAARGCHYYRVKAQ